MMGLALLISFLLILFSIVMFVDCWRYSEPLWLILFMLFFLPLIALYFVSTAQILSLFTCYGPVGHARRDSTAIFLLITSFIPFCFSMVYYLRKFRSRYLSGKPFFITMLVLCILFVLNYLISSH